MFALGIVGFFIFLHYAHDEMNMWFPRLLSSNKMPTKATNFLWSVAEATPATRSPSANPTLLPFSVPISSSPSVMLTEEPTSPGGGHCDGKEREDNDDPDCDDDHDSPHPHTTPTMIPSIIPTQLPEGSSNWTASTAPTATWQALATSSTGQYVFGATYNGYGVWNSSDYGTTWIQTDLSASATWHAIAASSSGQLVVAAAYNGAVYKSSNYGVSWSECTGAPSDYTWVSLACSSSCDYAVAAYAGGVYSASSYFAVWQEASTGITEYYAVAMSSSGQFAFAVGIAGVYISSDYGVTFSLSSAPISVTYSSVSCDSSGTYIAAVTSFGGIYYSSNGGSTWAKASGYPYNEEWASVVSDSTGQNLVAATGGSNVGNIYLSENYGRNWTLATTAPNVMYQSLASSSSGTVVYAGVYGGSVYIGDVGTSIKYDDFDDDLDAHGNDGMITGGSDGSDGLTGGVIAAIVIGALLFAMAVSYGLHWFLVVQGGHGSSSSVKEIVNNSAVTPQPAAAAAPDVELAVHNPLDANNI